MERLWLWSRSRLLLAIWPGVDRRRFKRTKVRFTHAREYAANVVFRYGQEFCGRDFLVNVAFQVFGDFSGVGARRFKRWPHAGTISIQLFAGGCSPSNHTGTPFLRSTATLSLSASR